MLRGFESPVPTKLTLERCTQYSLSVSLQHQLKKVD
nr:MAG TPA: hypothetical protein [Caudoviricetes sp.]